MHEWLYIGKTIVMFKLVNERILLKTKKLMNE